MTPYERFKNLPDATKYLKSGVSLESLDAQAAMHSDNEFAKRMVEAREQLFAEIFSIGKCLA